ncbi:MAG: sodium:calcium antiporter [Chitinophagales bacterium]
MINSILLFVGALLVLLLAARYFTKAAEAIGQYFKLPTFVIGVFIVGIGTSLPELVSAVMAVKNNVPEIVAGNIIGSNISNLLLITGAVTVINRQSIVLKSKYIFIDLHYLIGAFLVFFTIVFDKHIYLFEAIILLLIFFTYAFYLVKNDESDEVEVAVAATTTSENKFPLLQLFILLAASVAIYFGAEYTIAAVTDIATALQIAPSIIALTVLSLGTTLPELFVNIAAISSGKAEMAIGNILGSCIFNTLIVPSVASFFGSLKIPEDIAHFSLPMMMVSGLFFYLLTQDKRISIWEGLLFIFIYILFIYQVTTLHF